MYVFNCEEKKKKCTKTDITVNEMCKNDYVIVGEISNKSRVKQVGIM